MDFCPLDLSHKKILITGASSGIGRATSIYLSKLGAKLVLNGRNEERLKSTAMQLFGKDHQIVIEDLAQQEDLSEFFEKITNDGVKLNGLIHCAGIPFIMPLQSLTRNQLRKVMENNYYPFIELVRQYSKKKYSCGGSIVCISSILSVQPRPYETGYIASKAAVNASISSIAIELAKKGIRINGILAGNIMTEMVRKTEEQYGSDDLQQNIKQALLGFGEPDDIAGVCAFLVSDISKYITGRNIYADGGLL
jgi:NAD(P)-dependent dehydrogenase (short-subunit alcohol dehydrogenase family)